MHRRLQKLRRRSLVRIISFGIAIIAALGGFTAHGYFLAVRYRNQLEYTYQRALGDLSNYLSDINMALKKGLYAGTAAQLSIISSELWRDSGSAKACIAQMPVNDTGLQKVSKFLSQVGEYALTISKKMADGGKMTEEERKTLVQLSDNAASLSEEVSNMESELSEGRLWLGEVRRVVEKSETEKDVKTALSKGTQAAEEALAETPTLIYDGPFSDHLLKKESKLLKDAKEVSQEEARKKAAAMLSGKGGDIKDSGTEESATAAYIFERGDTRVAVTKAGGYPLYFQNPRDVGDSKLGFEEARDKAFQYLKSIGYESLKESYYMTTENVCVINFAYMDGKVICYPDLIKVGVALDNGEIVSLDARGYVMNHFERNLPAPKYTSGQASENVNSALAIENVSLTVIPKQSGAEKFCYEFACKNENGEDIYVYINAENLQEEEILILLKVDGGVLTY